MGRGLIAVLALSLAANVFLGGFVVGRLVGAPTQSAEQTGARDGRTYEDGVRDKGGKVKRKLNPRGEFGPDAGAALFFGLRNAPPGVRETFREVFIANAADMRERRREIFEARDGLRDVLTAPDWDRAAAEAAIAKLMAAEQARRDTQNAAVLEAFSKLSDEDRKALSELAKAFRSDKGARGRPFRPRPAPEAGPPHGRPPHDGPPPSEDG